MHALIQDTGSDVSDGDWDILCRAVQDRLTHLVSTSNFASSAVSAADVAQLRDGVLECVTALDLLRHAAISQRARRDGLEAAVFEAQTSLAQVRAALVGTQRGERRARHDATHDALTRLPNRGLLIERINERLLRTGPRQQKLAVMFLDLDQFKQVNDLHGHATGDALLRIVAARLRRVVRAQDVVSRIGGDEFACMIGNMDDRVQLSHLAGKMGDVISEPCTVSDLQLVVHASIGIATCPADAVIADALLNGADRAMYAAKRQRVRYAFLSRDDAVATAARQGPAPPTLLPQRS